LQTAYIGLSLPDAILQNAALQNASINLLIVAAIFSFVRLLDAFTFNKELGTLYIVLKRIVIDVLKWIVVFLIFAVAFQIAFMSITQQVDPDISVWTSTVSNGTFMGAYMTIIGDWATTMAVIEPSWFGVVLVSLYALIAQILLVNLLIAMMGDTFNNVRQNIKQEWPFWRYNTSWCTNSHLPTRRH